MSIASLAKLYSKNISVTVRTQLQHRGALAIILITFMVEPIVYLSVWVTVADQLGGRLAGMSTGAISAYFIAWTLVRIVNIAFSPTIFESRIRSGQFTGQLLRPMHPIHYDLSWFVGLKIPAIIMWLPIGVALTLVFKPVFEPTPLRILVFLVALLGAYLIRSLYLWLLGMVNLWTTRTAALFEMVLLAELVFSGRLVPMAFMPDWVRDTAALLPFYSTFGFPIDAIVGNLDDAAMLVGLAMQLGWTVSLALVLWLTWRRALRRYGAVGN